MKDIPTTSAFNLSHADKNNFMLRNMNVLTQFHLKNCFEYKTLMEKFGKIKPSYDSLLDIPFIPVRLFKYNNLLSVKKKDIVKTMTSSGTSGQSVSKIFPSVFSGSEPGMWGYSLHHVVKEVWTRKESGRSSWFGGMVVARYLQILGAEFYFSRLMTIGRIGLASY